MKPGSGKKVLLAMSGGVDSSVAAKLLKDDGYDVVGCFMRLRPTTDAPGATQPPSRSMAPRADPDPHPDDAADARLVAAMLGIRLSVLDFSLQFGRVVDYFVAEYNAGRTPNPCARCNRWIKFGAMLDYARSMDADYVATGHHARVVRSTDTADNPRTRLLRGRDPGKDQSYVLFGLTHEQLDRMILPVGEYEKGHIRRIAEQAGLPVADKPDSQDICFVPDGDYASLVGDYAPDSVRPGDILDLHGETIGRHRGHQHFTVGQRRGIGVAIGDPVYVVARDAAANTITVGPRSSLLAAGLVASDANWLAPRPTNAPFACQVKIRYNSAPAAASVRIVGGDGVEIRFDEPVFAVAPGQAAVCYDGDEVLGGAWIDGAL